MLEETIYEKELSAANKYPRRKCIYCVKYPCFRGQGTSSHKVNFAAYGCIDYQRKKSRK